MLRHLLLLACALAPALAPADEPEPPPPPGEVHAPRLGVGVGVGVPQAASLDLLYRPVPWLRLSAGPSWDYVGWGLHGGAVFSPVRWAVTPTLGIEVGRIFEADLNKVLSVDAGLQPLLERVQAQYLAATLGLEIGSQRGFALSLRLGLAWLKVDTHGSGQLTGSGGIAGQNDALVTVTSPTLRASTPTVQLGLQYYL
jgi:hypothetical protein